MSVLEDFLFFSIYCFSNLQCIANFPGFIQHTKLFLIQVLSLVVYNAAKTCKLLVLFKNELFRLHDSLPFSFYHQKNIFFRLGGQCVIHHATLGRCWFMTKHTVIKIYYHVSNLQCIWNFAGFGERTKLVLNVSAILYNAIKICKLLLLWCLSHLPFF